MFDPLPQNSRDLYFQMLSECALALKMNLYLDNYDAERYDYDGVDKSKIFDEKKSAYQFDWFVRSYERIYQTYKLFQDEYSQRLYLILIAYRIAGHHSVRIPLEFSLQDQSWQDNIDNEKITPSNTALNGIFGQLKHYDFEHNNCRYVVDCLGLNCYLHRRQYYFSRDGVDIAPDAGDYVIDGGACLGDSAIVFANSVGPKGMVYAFDPVHEHLEMLQYNAAQNPHLNIKALPYGISNIDIDSEPLRLNTYAPGFNINNKTVPLRSIDSLAIDGTLEKIDFLKMDIEGSEMQALTGALGSIRKYMPKLAISLYHRPDDIFDIPAFLHHHFPDYKMYLGHYTIHNEETVLYCTKH